MQFFTVSPNPQPAHNQTHFQKKIGYYNDNSTIKPSSSMLLHHHFMEVKDEQEVIDLLTNLGVLWDCKPHTNKQNQTVKYHLEKNTIESRKNTTGPNSKFDSSYLINMGFPNNINNFELSSIGINVEEKLFSGKSEKGKLVTGPFTGEYLANRHVQIVYSDDSKKFQMLDASGNQKTDPNTKLPRTTHNEFIFNLHLDNSNFRGNLETQLQNIAAQVQNISHDANFEKLFATEITNFSNSAVQEFYDYCYNPTQNLTILELDPTISHSKLAKLQKTLNIKQGQLTKNKDPVKSQELQDKITELNSKIQEINDIPTLLNSNLSHKTLEILQPAAASAIVAADNNPGIPPAADIDDNTEVPATILDNQANNSSDGSDLTSLTSKISNVLHIDDNLQNPDLSSSGEGAKDTPDTL